jgi:hypothetical protein
MTKWLLAVACLYVISCGGGPPASPPAPNERICPVLLATLAAVADTTAPLRVKTMTETPTSVLDGKDSEDRSIYISLLSRNLQAPQSVVEHFFNAKAALATPVVVPQCEAVPSRTAWHAELPSPRSDTVTVTLLLPLFIEGSSPERAVMYGAVLDRAGRAPPSLSDGDVASGSLHLLERREGAWTVVRSVGVWALLRE